MVKESEKFGPPYAVINLSKIGFRYFRLLIKTTPETRKSLIDKFINHPNIGWIFTARGWFNLGVGIWARDNTDINDINASIQRLLSSKDKIVYQSELTTLVGFGNRPVTKKKVEMHIIDSTIQPMKLSALSSDYLKLLTIDSSLTKNEYAKTLGITQNKLVKLNKKLISAGIIAGYQERINYAGKYFKVFINSSSYKNHNNIEGFIKKLWDDNNFVYFERADGKYDIEFEVILPDRKVLNERYLKYFSDYQVVELTKNIYTNLYPANKVANFNEIRDIVLSQKGMTVDLRNSKLWYLNYTGVSAYLNLYNVKTYAEAMKDNEISLFRNIVYFVRKNNSKNKFHLIDLGSGDGIKANKFIEILGQKNVKAYYPVDIQPIELSLALANHQRTTYSKHPTLLNFKNLDSRFPLELLPNEKQLYLFFGGTYGNFSIQQINSYLQPLIIKDTSLLLVSMPLRNNSKQTIIEPYANRNMEDIAFGPLKQIGFQKKDFVLNKKYPPLILQLHFKDNYLQSSFVLKNTVIITGRKFKSGTIFKTTVSWKPSLEEFKNALTKTFHVSKIFNNKNFAIALCKKK